MKKTLLLTLIPMALTFTACEDDHDDHAHEQELITTVTLTLTPAGGGSAVTVSWRDLDGDGGTAPVIGTLNLVRGTVYNGTVSLLNESETPAENITLEVQNEKDEHQFFYTFTPATAVTVDNFDRDSRNLPVGLTYRFTVAASAPATGTLNVKLSHFDGTAKNGTTPSDENDVNINIPVTFSSAN